MRVLVSLPDDLVMRMRAVMAKRQRSQLIAELLERELKKRERDLFKAAHEVELDEILNEEMKDWEVTVGDGIESDAR